MAKKKERKDQIPMSTIHAVIGVLGVLVIIGAFFIGFFAGKVSVIQGGTAAAGGDTVKAAPSPTPTPSEPGRAAVELGEYVKGDKDAPVEIVEFSDFQCPFCARFYTQTLGQIEEQYIKTGKVKLSYRDFPLSIHPQAQKAGEAAKCAGEQGKFWEMHDILFDNYQTLSVPNYKAWAAEIGLDSAEFDSCLDSGKTAAAVQADFTAGQAAGVRGTPAFFVNGKLISGAQPFSVFQQAIEAELA